MSWETIAGIVVVILAQIGMYLKIKAENKRASDAEKHHSQVEMRTALDEFSLNFLNRTQSEAEALRTKAAERDTLAVTVAELKGEVSGLRAYVDTAEDMERERDELRSELNKFRKLREKLLLRIEGYNMVIVFTTDNNDVGAIATIVHDDNSIVYGTFSSDFMPRDIALLDSSTFKEWYNIDISPGSLVILEEGKSGNTSNKELYNKVISYSKESSNNKVHPLMFNFKKFDIKSLNPSED